MKKYAQFLKESTDAWDFESKFQNFVWETTAWYDEDDQEYYDGLDAKQSYGLVDLIKNGVTEGEFNLTFTDEVKDGRSESFETDAPLKIKGKTFTYNNITIKILDIEYIGSNDQDSTYNRYIDYKFKVKCQLTYK